MKRIAALLAVLTAFSCAQQRKPVSDSDVTGIRPAIAVEYAGVPTLTVYSSPNDTSAVIGNYGYTESIPILSRSGDWSEIRTFDGTGWVKSWQLMNADQAKELAKDPSPRFYIEPVAIRFNARGEIVQQAKVNSEGLVYEVKTISNTTGIQSLAEENAIALRNAKFFPMIEKGQRKTFTYERRLIY